MGHRNAPVASLGDFGFAKLAKVACGFYHGRLAHPHSGRVGAGVSICSMSGRVDCGKKIGLRRTFRDSGS